MATRPRNASRSCAREPRSCCTRTGSTTPRSRLDRASPLGGRGLYEKVFTLDRTDGRVAVVGGFGIGAPVAAIVLEELIAIGVERALSIGTAGALQPDLASRGGRAVHRRGARRGRVAPLRAVRPRGRSRPRAHCRAGTIDLRRAVAVAPRDLVDDRHSVPRDRRGGAPLPGGRRAVRRDGSGGALHRGRRTGAYRSRPRSASATHSRMPSGARNSTIRTSRTTCSRSTAPPSTP